MVAVTGPWVSPGGSSAGSAGVEPPSLAHATNPATSTTPTARRNHDTAFGDGSSSPDTRRVSQDRRFGQDRR